MRSIAGRGRHNRNRRPVCLIERPFPGAKQPLFGRVFLIGVLRFFATLPLRALRREHGDASISSSIIKDLKHDSFERHSICCKRDHHN